MFKYPKQQQNVTYNMENYDDKQFDMEISFKKITYHTASN